MPHLALIWLFIHKLSSGNQTHGRTTPISIVPIDEASGDKKGEGNIGICKTTPSSHRLAELQNVSYLDNYVTEVKNLLEQWCYINLLITRGSEPTKTLVSHWQNHIAQHKESNLSLLFSTNTHDHLHFYKHWSTTCFNHINVCKISGYQVVIVILQIYWLMYLYIYSFLPIDITKHQWWR